MGDCRPKGDEISKKVIIEEPYGKSGAYPGGLGATLILSKVSITSTSKSLLKKLNSLSLEDSPSSNTTSPICIEESRSTSFNWIFRNKSNWHAEKLFLQQLEQEVQNLDDELMSQRLKEEGRLLELKGQLLDGGLEGQRLQQEGQRLQREGQRLQQEGSNKVTEIDIKLIQNYAPCHECADEIIKYKAKMENWGRKVSIKITFANYYYWIGSNTCEYGKKNLEGLKRMNANKIDLQLLQGEECWETLFEDGYLVDLTEKDKEKLREKAYSKKRIEREAEDRKIRREKSLF